MSKDKISFATAGSLSLAAAKPLTAIPAELSQSHTAPTDDEAPRSNNISNNAKIIPIGNHFNNNDEPLF